MPGYRALMRFARTIAKGCFGEHRSLCSIAQKGRKLLLQGPVANKLPTPRAPRSVVAGLLGVSFYNQRQTSPTALSTHSCAGLRCVAAGRCPSHTFDDPGGIHRAGGWREFGFVANSITLATSLPPPRQPGRTTGVSPRARPPLPGSALNPEPSTLNPQPSALLCPSEPTGAVAQDLSGCALRAGPQQDV